MKILEKITRRGLFTSVMALPFMGKMRGATAKTSAHFAQSFDARVWAKEFVSIVKQNPSIATDEGTMIGWFANALMRGYDEMANRHDREVREAGREKLQALQIESIRGAVARGWCADVNSHKVMDLDLAEAITQELLKLPA